jgi:hypothetical protein
MWAPAVGRKPKPRAGRALGGEPAADKAAARALHIPVFLSVNWPIGVPAAPEE